MLERYKPHDEAAFVAKWDELSVVLGTRPVPYEWWNDHNDAFYRYDARIFVGVRWDVNTVQPYFYLTMNSKGDDRPYEHYCLDDWSLENLLVMAENWLRAA